MYILGYFGSFDKKKIIKSNFIHSNFFNFKRNGNLRGMIVSFYPYHSFPLKLSNNRMNFLFPQLKLSNNGINEYSKIIIFHSFPFHFIPSSQIRA